MDNIGVWDTCGLRSYCSAIKANTARTIWVKDIVVFAPAMKSIRTVGLLHCAMRALGQQSVLESVATDKWD